MKKPTSESSATGLESNQNSKKQGKGFQCDQCDFDFKTENGLKIHKGKSHKEVSSPEKMRKPSRVRKSKNFPDSKIFTAKTFRIMCVNRNIGDFATNARKT